MKQDKQLIEALNIRYGWTYDSVLSIVPEDLIKMTAEEIEKFVEVSSAIYDNSSQENMNITEIPVIDGVVYNHTQEEV